MCRASVTITVAPGFGKCAQDSDRERSSVVFKAKHSNILERDKCMVKAVPLNFQPPCVYAQVGRIFDDDDALLGHGGLPSQSAKVV